MENNEVRRLLNDFVLGQQEAMAAFTFALARVIDREQFAEALRLQMLSFTVPARTDSEIWRDRLITAAWQAIRHPAPPDR